MNRRSAQRYPLEASAVLVVPGEHGPVVCTGRTVDVSLGGCRVAFDEALPGAVGAGVLLVRTSDRELAMLTAPLTGDAAASVETGLRFVQPTEPDDAWPTLVEGLAATP